MHRKRESAAVAYQRFGGVHVETNYSVTSELMDPGENRNMMKRANHQESRVETAQPPTVCCKFLGDWPESIQSTKQPTSAVNGARDAKVPSKPGDHKSRQVRTTFVQQKQG